MDLSDLKYTDADERKKMKRKLDKFLESQEKRGIVYLSRIPPFMKVEKLRHIMSQFGEVDRIYLNPEDPGARKRRLKHGGNRKTKYEDGWVEFLDRRIAKRVALSLNNTPVGGKKMNFFHDDIWNMRYIPKFKWRHLTEKIAQERRDKSLKLRAEVSEARKEGEEYLERVERAKAIEGMKERRKKAKVTSTDDEDKIRRVFAQRAPKGEVRADSGSKLSVSDDTAVSTSDHDGFLEAVFGNSSKGKKG